MKNTNTIKVNFKGGVIPPADLYNILLAARKAHLMYVRFGLRQQLLLDVEIEELETLTNELDSLGAIYEINGNEYPNIISARPALELFAYESWLTDTMYQEILDSFTHAHRLKINLSDANQSFTPLLTGNVNWVASRETTDYWHLFIRFPKTNTVYEWKDLVHSRDLAAMSRHLEETILQERGLYYDNPHANGDALYTKMQSDQFQTRPTAGPLALPPFKLAYYEGMNRYGDDLFWLGIYRRDELFSIKFLKKVCLLCRETGIDHLFATPWKSIIIKEIKEINKKDWYHLLDTDQVNVRHAANELNFQVEDNSPAALKLKHYLVKYLNDDDTRTFGVCIGIKTRKKSEVFCSILVRRKPVLPIGKWALFYVYDILCAKDFNPNERTDFAFSRDNPRFVLAEQLRRAVLSFYYHPGDKDEAQPVAPPPAELLEQEQAL